VAFNEHNSQPIQQQEPVASSPEGPQTKKGQGKRQSIIISSYWIFYEKQLLYLNRIVKIKKELELRESDVSPCERYSLGEMATTK
jgi:hypothetical protein